MRQTANVLIATLILLAPSAWAGQGTPDEAKALAIKAAEYLKSAGPEKAFPEFDAKAGPWHDRDLYVFVFDTAGMMLSNGDNPGLNHRNLLDLRDPDGKQFIRDFEAIKDAGWVNYRWRNPLSQEIEPKASYVIRAGDYIIGVGAYTK
jgi:hypothetical protein